MPGESLDDHFEHPRNVGEVARPDGRGRAENPVCGDEVRITLRIEAGRIGEIRFRAFGCHATIAATSLLTERLRGASVAEALARTPAEVRSSFADFPRGKAHAAEVAVGAVRAALLEVSE